MGTVTAMIWITSNKSVVYPILLFIVTIYSAQIVCSRFFSSRLTSKIYHLARPNTDQETMKFALSNHLFAQDAAISSFAHAFHQTNTNIFVFLGGSGIAMIETLPSRFELLKCRSGQVEDDWHRS